MESSGAPEEIVGLKVPFLKGMVVGWMLGMNQAPPIFWGNKIRG